jgi:hypothetical protein
MTLHHHPAAPVNPAGEEVTMSVSATSPRVRQVVDWRAAIWAGLIAGLVFLLFNVFIGPLVIGGNGWVIVRLFASLLMGSGVLVPPATFDGAALLAGLAVNFGLSVIFSLLVALIIHRGGLISGILGGGLLGLALYGINFYTLTIFFPWFFPLRSWVFLLAHALFGALAGGIYEALEVEIYVPVEEEKQGGA